VVLEVVGGGNHLILSPLLGQACSSLKEGELGKLDPQGDTLITRETLKVVCVEAGIVQKGLRLLIEGRDPRNFRNGFLAIRPPCTFVCKPPLGAICHYWLFKSCWDSTHLFNRLLSPSAHHHCAGHPGGFCPFNQTSLAMKTALEANKSVLLFDIDGHHGNGERFYCQPQ